MKRKELLQNKDISYYVNHVFGVLLLSTWLAWIGYVLSAAIIIIIIITITR
jgi:hypothetical protein